MKDSEQKEPRTEQPPLSEPIRPVPGTQPFTRYKVAELIVCAVAVILGLLYLYAGHLIPLGVLLPVYAVCFAAIVPLRWLDAKKNGQKGGWLILSVAIWGLLALAVTAATVVYFIWY